MSNYFSGPCVASDGSLTARCAWNVIRGCIDFDVVENGNGGMDVWVGNLK